MHLSSDDADDLRRQLDRSEIREYVRHAIDDAVTKFSKDMADGIDALADALEKLEGRVVLLEVIAARTDERVKVAEEYAKRGHGLWAWLITTVGGLLGLHK